MATIINKIKNSIEDTLNITCLYGSEGFINAKLDFSNYPLAFFTDINTGEVDSFNSNFREKINVAIFFVEPTTFDYNSVENEELIEECKTLALAWVDKTKLDKDLDVRVISTARVYNINDSILTGFAINCEITEHIGLSCLNRYNMKNLLIEKALKETGYAVYYNVAESTPSIVYNIVGNRLKLNITLEAGDTIEDLFDLITYYFSKYGISIKTVAINGYESWYQIILIYKIKDDSPIPGPDISVDLSMYDILGQLQNTRETANCYVISSIGDYCFPLVYGNGIKNGVNNQLAYTNQGESNQSPIVNYLGNQIVNPYIELDTNTEASTVDVLLSDENNLIRGARIINRPGESCRFVRFRVSNIPDTGANAVIGVKDANGNIMWSWHIWLWKDDLTPVTITNYDSTTYRILPVNLGSKYDDNTTYPDEPKRHIKNWFYQYGRKDPMLLPNAYYNTTSRASNYGSLEYTTNESPASNTQTAIKNPNVFYSGISWLNQNTNICNYWDATNNATGYNSKVVVKTVYDPCPRGFNVPGTNVFTGFTTTGENTGSALEYNIIGDFCNGYYFKKNSEDLIGIFFPASGDSDYTGLLSGVGTDGYYWTTGFYTNNGRNDSTELSFDTRRIEPKEYYYMGAACSIRPCAEIPVPSYTVTTATSGSGSVSGGGEYFEGTTCTLTAIPGTGYNFDSWTVGGETVSTSTTYSFTVNSNVTVTAVFVPKQFTISTTTTGSGTVLGGGSYAYGTTCTLTATPGTGYEFVDYKVNNVEISTDNPYSFTVTEDLEIAAVFTPMLYVITATVSGNGTVTGDGNYYYGDTCTLTAVDGTGYDFSEWIVGGSTVSTDNPYSFTVTGSITVTAVFELEQYTISTSVTPSGSGSVSGGGTYNYGETCNLSATANTGYDFYRYLIYGETYSLNPEVSFTVTDNWPVVAEFTPKQYTISTSVNPSGTGTASGAGQYYYNTSCTLTATPATGYQFDSWTINGSIVSSNNPYTFTVTEGNTYIANFEPIQYTVTGSVTPSGGGTISGAGSYNYGTTCTLTASTNTGYTFTRWTIGGVEVSTSTTYSFMVSDNVTVVAEFTPIQYTITATSAGNGSVSGGGSYAYGTTCTLTATPNTGYSFDDWKVSGAFVSSNNPYSFTVTGDLSIVGNFSINTYTVTIIQDQNGTVTGDGNYDHGDTCTLTATPNTGYEFVSYSIVGSETSIVTYDNPFSFTVTENVTVTPIFDLIPPNYLKFTAKTGTGNVMLTNNYGNPSSISLQYSTDGRTWNNYTLDSNISLSNIDDYVMFRGDNNVFSVENKGYNFISGAGIEVSGNVTSLYDSTCQSTTLPNSYCFYHLFYYSDITDISELELPATTLANGCYFEMFSNSKITSIPSGFLPATTLNNNCYRGMFKSCERLNSVSSNLLPATTLNQGCYQEMFSSAGLSSIPSGFLPATTLAKNCYFGMFSGRSGSLTTIPSNLLPATTLAEGCYLAMFSSKYIQTVPSDLLPATTLAKNCYKQMFYDCINLRVAPELPATTLAEGCYSGMFFNCTNSQFTEVSLPATTLALNCYERMFRLCSNINKVNVAFTDWGSNNTEFTDSWLDGVSSTGTFNCPSSLSDVRGISNIPTNWTKENGPEPLRFTANTSGSTIKLHKNGNPDSISLQYSIDGTTWNNYTLESTITLANVDDYVIFKGNNSNFSTGEDNYYQFQMTGSIAASGVITTLYSENIFKTTLPNNYCFRRLFSGCSALTSVPALPATTLRSSCYNQIFMNCTGLTSVPANLLPASNGQTSCYIGMFFGCTNLVNAPNINCSATQESFSRMFYGCTSLSFGPSVWNSSIDSYGASYACNYMFDECSSLTSIEIPYTRINYTGILNGMFNNCSNLESITVHFTDWNSGRSTSNWVSGVSTSSTAQFICPHMLSDIRSGNNYIPLQWLKIDLT